ncbi:GNAT family N-acetyltransferase [Bradyrhizobium sp. UFLA05-112]
MSDRFRIRSATMSDAQLLYEWRNNDSTRRMSKSRELVGWDDHVAWLDRRLRLDQPNLFVFEMGGEPVATFRIDDQDVSYTVAPDRRGQGIAGIMLSEVRSRFGRLRAQIYARNAASIRVAQKADLEVMILDDERDLTGQGSIDD